MWFQRRCVKLSVCVRKATEKPGLIGPPRVRANGLESLITQGRFLSKLIHQDKLKKIFLTKISLADLATSLLHHLFWEA